MNSIIYLLLLTTPEYSMTRKSFYKKISNSFISAFKLFFKFSMNFLKKVWSFFVRFKLDIASFSVLVIIFSVWYKYPTIVQYMDLSANNEKLIASKHEQATPLPSDEPKKESKATGYAEIGEKYGTFGDTFGSLNTLFSGFAFAILITTMFMQRRELHDQREEIKRSNDIAEAQRQITANQEALIKQQVKDTRLQSFNLTFYKYIDEKKVKLNNLSFDFGRKVQGEDCFAFYKEALLKTIKRINIALAHYSANQIPIIQSDVIHKFLFTALTDTEKDTQKLFENSNYFMHFNFILEYLHTNSEPEDFEKNLKAFLSFTSTNELITFFWFSVQHFDQFKAMKEYNLINYVNFSSQREILSVFRSVFETKDNTNA